MGNRERILEREPTAVAPPSSTSLMNNGQVTYETNEHEKGEKKYKGGKKKEFFGPFILYLVGFQRPFFIVLIF
jgi:hypothetical protein